MNTDLPVSKTRKARQLIESAYQAMTSNDPDLMLERSNELDGLPQFGSRLDNTIDAVIARLRVRANAIFAERAARAAGTTVEAAGGEFPIEGAVS